MKSVPVSVFLELKMKQNLSEQAPAKGEGKTSATDFLTDYPYLIISGF